MWGGDGPAGDACAQHIRHRYRPTRTSDVWVRPKRDKSVKLSPHCRTTDAQPVARVGNGNDVRLGCLRGRATRAQCHSLNTRLHEWRARRCQAVIDVRHDCGVTAASVDSCDCQVGAIKGDQRVALDVQLQCTADRDGAFRSSYIRMAMTEAQPRSEPSPCPTAHSASDVAPRRQRRGLVPGSTPHHVAYRVRRPCHRRDLR